MRLLLNILILVAVAITATNYSFSKKYNLVPNDTLIMNGVLEDLQTLAIQQQNISKDTLNLKWKKIIDIVPENWEASVCDNSFCYTSLIESGSMIPLFPDDYGFVLLHITPKINYGESIIQYAVWDVMAPEEIDTLTFILKVENTTKINSSQNFNISTYPNPADELINIAINTNNLYSYNISDIYSRIFLSGHLSSNINEVMLHQLSSGIYLLEIKDSDGNIQSKQTFIKK